MSKKDPGHFREQRERTNAKGGKATTQSDSTSDFNHCVIKHTVNGDGFNGANGDLATLKCIIDRKAERVAENATRSNSSDKDSCIIANITEIRYDNSFLKNNSMETLLLLYKNGGMESVNLALSNNIDSEIVGDYCSDSTF